MRFRHRYRNLEKGEYISLTPLIDCVFLLLIFFMLTSSFIFQPGINVNLPKAVTSEIIGQESFIITVTEDNLIYFNDRPLTMKELGIKLKAFSSGKKPILIKADNKASLGRIVEVWDLCRDLGISQVNIATNKPQTK